MKIIECEQGSDAWRIARAGKITASEAKAILTPKFEKKDSKAVNTFLGRKLAERWLQAPIPEDEIDFAPVEWGKILEAEARPMLNCVYGYNFKKAGLIVSDGGFTACSPDGLGDGIGCEIKSPLIQTHCKYCALGVVPEDYIVQVHFSLYVSGLPTWIFMSYRRNMPPLIIEVKRDEEIISKIDEAVDAFGVKLNLAWLKLLELNGGKPPERTPTVDELRDEETHFDIH